LASILFLSADEVWRILARFVTTVNFCILSLSFFVHSPYRSITIYTVDVPIIGFLSNKHDGKMRKAFQMLQQNSITVEVFPILTSSHTVKITIVKARLGDHVVLVANLPVEGPIRKNWG